MDDGQSEHDERFGYGIFRIDLMLEELGNSSSDTNVKETEVGSGLLVTFTDSYQAERRKTPSVPPANSTKAAEWLEFTD